LVLRKRLIPDMALSHIVRFGHRSFLALLFPRVATGRSLTRCAHGQTKRSFRNSFCCHCSSRNANVASLAWRRTRADRRGHPGLQIMNPLNANQMRATSFLNLKFGKPWPGSSIRIGGWTWFRNRKRLGLNHGARKGSERRGASDVDI